MRRNGYTWGELQDWPRTVMTGGCSLVAFAPHGATGNDDECFFCITSILGDKRADFSGRSSPRILSAITVYSVHLYYIVFHLKCSTIGIGFNGAETNCGVACILGILLMNGYTVIRYLQEPQVRLWSVLFELMLTESPWYY